MNTASLNSISQKVGEIAGQIEIINSSMGDLVVGVTNLGEQMRFFLHLQLVLFIVLVGVAAVSIFNLVLLKRKGRHG